jgi:hypothetical protein
LNVSLRDAFLPILDSYRGALDTVYGLRRFDVTVRVTTWAPGSLPGSQGSTKVPVDTPLTVNGDARPKVEQLSQRTIIASGGLYQDQDLRIGPLTPSYSVANGIDPSVFDPAGASNVEVLFLLQGPGLPAAGAWFSKVGQEVTANFHYHLVVRAAGAVNG